MTPIQRAIDAAGGLTALANALKVTPQVVNNWRSRKNVPAEKCREIEDATKGVVKRHELRPDVFGKETAA